MTWSERATLALAVLGILVLAFIYAAGGTAFLAPVLDHAGGAVLTAPGGSPAAAPSPSPIGYVYLGLLVIAALEIPFWLILKAVDWFRSK